MDKASLHSGDPEKNASSGSSHLSASGADGAGAPGNAHLEKRVWRKLDMWILPVVTMFYLLSFLDRSNIGNARVAGLQKDLKMTNNQYSIALTVTYVPYIAAELPSNLLLKANCGTKLDAAHDAFSLGSGNCPARQALVTSPEFGSALLISNRLTGIVHNYHGLLVCRFFLGLFEGGVFPGLVLYLSFFYPRQKLQWRVSAFFSAASISGAFSGLLAFGIINMKGVNGRPGWAWIFILEGVFTIAFGLASFVLLPRSPGSAHFLNEEEKDYIRLRLKEDGATGKDESEDSFSFKEVKKAFLLPQLWLISVILFMDGTILYALAYFTPSIVQGLGYTASRAQLMSVPPFAVAFFVAMIGAYISDRYRCRGLMSIFASILCIIGFSIFLKSTHHKTQYASLFFSIPGTYLAAPTLSTWNANNAAPFTRRATGVALGFMITNSGGILATWLLGSLSAAPRYTLATRVLLSFSVLMVVFSALNLWYLDDQNKKKKAIRATMTRDQEKPGKGDQSAWFEYAL